MRPIVLAIAFSIASIGATRAEAADPPKTEAPFVDQLKDLPAPRSIRQSAMIQGRRVDYLAAVGAIDLRDDNGKLLGEVVYTAYTLPGAAGSSRPVTFAVNGGPGASSVALNFGALGPRHVETGRGGDTASSSAVLVDNPNSWLPFTDLVFIDPIGTGYSRSRVDEAGTKKAFMSADADIHYLSEVIYQWLSGNNRMKSPKYLVGESYGGYRVPRIAYYLQIHSGIGLSGLTLVSPWLDAPALTAEASDALSPLTLMTHLPSLAASHLEEEGKPLDSTTMAPVEQYVRTEFLSDFFAGASDPVATRRLSAKVAALVGLDPALVQRIDGRINMQTALRERHRDLGTVSSGYDARVKALDPFPAKESIDYFDPLLGSSAPYTEGMVDFVQNELGWKADGRYKANNYDLYLKFDGDTRDTAVSDLRKAIANDSQLQVLISHGWNDLSCPYFMSKLLIEQMPRTLTGSRLRLRVYPGGHMFYDRAASSAAWRADAQAMYVSGS
jgi:carboxypeptidase C (cathepsin A)